MYAQFNEKLLARYKASDLLFVIGAGASRNHPSNIPLGEELTKFILEKACGESESSVFINTWHLFSTTIREYDENLVFTIPRLETILGCIDEMDNMLERNSILQGITAWANTPPNNNHDCLASFVKNGANIITTNFDLGIENSYTQQYGALNRKIIDGISVFSSEVAGEICHIHGCALDDTNQLGATMKKVKNGFGDSIELLLKAMLKQSKLIIFLGYSVSDSFDITPFFESTETTAILFVQHSTGTTVNYPTNLDKLVALSKHAYRIGANTTDFLKELLALLHIPTRYPGNIDNTFDWKSGFNALPPYDKDNQIINFMSLRYHLGISTDIFMANRCNIMNDIENVYNNLNNTNPRIQDYYQQAIRSFSVLKDQKALLPNQIVHEKVDYINKEYLILLRNECEYYVNKYSDTSLIIDENDQTRMEWLLNILIEYSSYTYSNVQYVSYIIASLKYASVFCARLNKGYHPEYSKRELVLALDISYIEGTIAALIHLAQHCLVYGELNDQIEVYKSDAIKALMTAYKLSTSSGYIYHVKRIQLLNESFGLHMNTDK